MAYQDGMKTDRLAQQMIKQVTEDTTLDPKDTRVAAAIPAQGSITITLPSVAEAFGRGPYFIRVDTDGGGTSVVVQDSDETPDNYQSDALTAVGDRVCLVSDSQQWYELFEKST